MSALTRFLLVPVGIVRVRCWRSTSPCNQSTVLWYVPYCTPYVGPSEDDRIEILRMLRSLTKATGLRPESYGHRLESPIGLNYRKARTVVRQTIQLWTINTWTFPCERMIGLSTFRPLWRHFKHITQYKKKERLDPYNYSPKFVTYANQNFNFSETIFLSNFMVVHVI